LSQIAHELEDTMTPEHQLTISQMMDIPVTRSPKAMERATEEAATSHHDQGPATRIPTLSALNSEKS
jgi:hypothetical protein